MTAVAEAFSVTSHGETIRFRSTLKAATVFDPDTIVSELQVQGLGNASIKVLSKDPLLFLVPNLLTDEECLAYQSYVSSKSMTRSNPPEVSLEFSKLWPLPILATLSGLPPLLRLYETVQGKITPMNVLTAVLPNIFVALALMMSLAWLVVLPLMRKMAEDSSRTSVACALNQIEDLSFIDPLLQRASVAAQQPPTHWEAPVVTRYEPGAIFSRHGDASPTRGSEWQDLGGQRIVTCICYLNTLEYGGGETYFDKLDIAVKPEMGTALFFQPADAVTWKADDRTTHESMPAATDKWIVQLFGRAQVVPAPLGLPEAVSLVPSSIVDPKH